MTQIAETTQTSAGGPAGPEALGCDSHGGGGCDSHGGGGGPREIRHTPVAYAPAV